MADVKGSVIGPLSTSGGGGSLRGSVHGLGGSTSTPTEPTITFVTTGAIDWGDTITVEIEGATEGYVITAQWGSTREIVWDGAFGVSYQGTANEQTDDAGDIEITFRRDGGWPGSALVVRVLAMGGLLADESESYPVTVEPEVDLTHTPELTAAQLAFRGAVDFKLDADGDLDLTGGRLSFTSGVEGVAQAIKIRLQSFRGEWFANLDNGVPWFQSILVKNPNIPAVREYLRQAILDAPFVASISSLELDFDRATRHLTVRWRVVASDGQTVDGADTFTGET